MNAWAIALDSIWHHRLRSLLTALGIVIGVFAVVTLTSLGGSVKQYISGQFSKFGANLITVAPAAPGSGSGSGKGHHHVTLGPVQSILTPADAQAIAALPAKDDVKAAAPIASVPATVSANGQVAGGAVVGTTAGYFSLEQLKFTAGGASAGFGNGAVLGHALAKDLFGSTPPVGQTVTIANTSFPVVGVLAHTGNQFGGDPGQTAYIPVSAALTISHSQHVAEIVVGATSDATVNTASAAVRQLLDQRHSVHAFQVITAAQILSTINKTLSVITSVLSGIAAISLLVGGIGIMNIMLVTVTERIREIGTRKALGARDSDILVQFLVESVLLAVLGGAVGTGMSALASRIVGHAIHFTIGLTPSSVVIALLFSVFVGVVFGVLPAMNAARQMPADALRSE
jgi:putative ABC transport system permease protein